MVFGWRTPTYEDAKVKQLFDGFPEFAEVNQAGVAAILDSFPLLTMLSDFILRLSRTAKELHNREKTLYLSHWLKVEEEVRDVTVKPCFCEELAAQRETEGLSDDQAAYIRGTLLEAGSDTTPGALYTFVQAMLL